MNQPTRIQELVGQLSGYRTRAAARRELAQIGAAAAPALLQALQDQEAPENARWSALSLLAQWRHEPAVPVLVKLVASDPHLRGDAVRALREITGQDIGEDAAAWAAAVAPGAAAATATDAQPAEGTEADTAAPDMIDLFRNAVGDVATKLSWEEPGYVYLRLPLPEGRKQQLLVTFDETDAEGRGLATLYTECGPASPAAQATIQRRNDTARHGRFEIDTDEEGEAKVVMRTRLPVTELKVAELRDIILSMAADADALEFELTDSDHI